MIKISKSVEETYAIAQDLVKKLQPGDVILLNGDLGAGKTTFTKGLALGLGITEPITSPTFTFMKSYEGKLNLYHFDMYRVSDEDELYELGLQDYLYMGGVCVIEWNKFEDIEQHVIKINISRIDDNSRSIEIID